MWGLDDYQCLPFMWGAAQLSNHASFTPASIHKEALLREASPDYLYFAAVLLHQEGGSSGLPSVSWLATRETLRARSRDGACELHQHPQGGCAAGPFP